MLTALYQGVFKRTSTFVFTVAVGALAVGFMYRVIISIQFFVS